MREDGSITKPGGTGLLMAGLIVAGLMGMGTYITIRSQNTPSQEDLSAVLAPASETVDRSGEPAAQAEGQTEADTAAVATQEEAKSPPPITPSISEVRLEDDGLAVIGGRAEPGATVSVLIDGTEVATTQADARGFFAAVAFVGRDEGARILTLQAEAAGVTIASTEDVILAPVARQLAQVDPTAEELKTTDETDAGSVGPADGVEEEKRKDDRLARIVPDETGGNDPDPENTQVGRQPQGTPPPPVDDVLALSSDVTTPAPRPRALVSEALEDVSSDGPGDLPDDVSPEATNDFAVDVGSQPINPDQAPATSEEPSQQPIAVLKSTQEGVTLLQTDAPPTVSIGIDTIGYSAQGEVELSGRATLGSFEARLYLDNRFVSSLQVDADGTWRGTVPDVDTGIYTLRVDEVNAAGDVTSRVETPFRREAPSVLAQAIAGQDGLVQAVTVQTGDTLWAIARERYGEGLLFVRVFEANSDAIRDPNLIYPGQVFDLPIE
ncbi:MAG: LysM peptidoglycan-binding domain-containing protein [Paracoccaceae bacterium]|nr:LysM peptidoglycan-binding domain-containing protein [Paracoccaceae bacterium]